MSRLVAKFLRDEGGNAGLEYGLLAGLASFAAIGVFKTFGYEMQAELQAVSDALG